MKNGMELLLRLLLDLRSEHIIRGEQLSHSRTHRLVTFLDGAGGGARDESDLLLRLLEVVVRDGEGKGKERHVPIRPCRKTLVYDV